MSDPSPLAPWEAPWQPPPGLRPAPTPPRSPARPARAGRSTAVLDLDVDTTPPRQLADEVVELFRQVDRLHGGGPGPAGPGRRARRRRLRVRDARPRPGCGTTPVCRPAAASDLVRTARVVRERLPATREALRSGEVTVQHARTICRTVHGWSTHTAVLRSLREAAAARRGRPARRRPRRSTPVRSPVSPPASGRSSIREGALADAEPRPRAAVADHGDAPSTAWSVSTACSTRSRGRSCSPPSPRPRRRRGPDDRRSARPASRRRPGRGLPARPRHGQPSRTRAESALICW